MVRLNKIYTRTGDDGSTGLVSGDRRAKDDARIEAFGTVDEANCTIGMARLHTQGSELDAVLSRIQNDFFDLGADLATPHTDKKLDYEPLRMSPFMPCIAMSSSQNRCRETLRISCVA